MSTWIHRYQLFLFDFDGLLVNTEDLHYAAYVEMCKERGFDLDWSMERFFEAAHFNATGLREGIYAKFPALFAQEPRWEVLYEEKKRAYMRLLMSGKLSLMPGVAPLLKELETAGIKRCVVTNSTAEQTECIRDLLPELKSIPEWITRESYAHPKPHPECYQKAVEKLGRPGDRVIGFEDSFRGFQALTGAGVKGVLIAPRSHPQTPSLPQGILHFESFSEISSSVLE
ncbi:MAG: HAD family phosphatase [Chlamydiales bacterium]|nr:HAD family phosphatase [Chlamydiales bacterium]